MINQRRSAGEWLADYEVMLGTAVITLAAAAFSLAPVWW